MSVGLSEGTGAFPPTEPLCRRCGSLIDPGLFPEGESCEACVVEEALWRLRQERDTALAWGIPLLSLVRGEEEAKMTVTHSLPFGERRPRLLLLAPARLKKTTCCSACGTEMRCGEEGYRVASPNNDQWRRFCACCVARLATPLGAGDARPL